MPIPIRESEALKLASLITQLLALRDDSLPVDLEPDEIKLVVDRRRSRLLVSIENLGLQVRPDLPKAEPAPDSSPDRAGRAEEAYFVTCENCDTPLACSDSLLCINPT